VALISITRLRVRSRRFFPPFAGYAFRAIRQARRSSGYYGGKTYTDARLTFWTATAGTTRRRWKSRHRQAATSAIGHRALGLIA
jgi:hypothetical protein